MCENFVIVSSQGQALARYSLRSNEFCFPIHSPSIISGGDKAWVITSRSPDTLQSMKFGYTSEVSQKRIDMLNLRTEEVDRDDNEDEYDRLMRIFTKPDFAAALHSFRCVVLIDAFLVSSPDNSNYLIHMQNKERPFAIAGIYANWLNPETNLYETGFCILTAASNPMLRRVGAEHMPVILTPQNVSKWLDIRLERRVYLPLIHTFPDDLMNGYPVSGKIFSPGLTNDNLQPTGQKLKPDQVNAAKHQDTGTGDQTTPVIRQYRSHKEKNQSGTPWFESHRSLE
ncbi:MAG TPA: SOS response-associated peptidase family protein [Prolixibacteraceae bacterium]|nr:SOS response-associated peptidase family protein [Prolixibacteraceae bacterium]